MAPYGRILEWYRDANKSRILVQAVILSPDWVPRSFVVSRGTLIGGMGRSWSVPIYILNGNFPDAFPADEDPVPFDGKPHPEHGLVVFGANHLEPNWQNELQGATHNLGFFGGNPHPNPAHLVHDQQINQHPIQHQPNQQPDDMEEDEDNVSVDLSDSAQRSSQAFIQYHDRGHPTKPRLVGPHRAALYRGRWGPGRRQEVHLSCQTPHLYPNANRSREAVLPATGSCHRPHRRLCIATTASTLLRQHRIRRCGTTATIALGRGTSTFLHLSLIIP